jgi:hypothetical protein
VIGYLGTYCWQDACVDAFEIPPLDSLPAVDGQAAQLSFRVTDGAFYNVGASYGPGAMDELVPLDEAGQSYDPDTTATPPPLLTEADLAVPPPGDWVVYIVIRAADGEAHYAWHVTVP